MIIDNAAMTNWTRRVADATGALLPEAGSLAWLLRQSLHTHIQRLAILPALRLGPGPQRILDVGAGTGAMCLDMAWASGHEAQFLAVDRDQQAIDLLQKLALMLQCRIETRQGEVCRLPVETSSQDLTICRFLFQHLDSPAIALDEMVRVTAPGGRIAVIDVDDGAWLSEPAESPALRRLNEAVGRLQSMHATGRHIGRKLYGLFRTAGLAELQILAVPRIRLGTYFGRDPAMESHQKEFYLNHRDRLMTAGLLTAETFEEGISALEDTFTADEFGFACEFLAIGRVPVQSPDKPPKNPVLHDLR